jgi:hypothetical protein
MDIQDIKKRLPILTVLSHYDIKPDKNNHIRCPFHADDKPSCKIYPETGTYSLTIVLAEERQATKYNGYRTKKAVVSTKPF